MAGYNYTKKKFTLFMAGYSYTKRSVHSSWLVTITLKEVFTLFMAGYNYTKRSVHSLHGWLQLH
jgi:hypothetical protein